MERFVFLLYVLFLGTSAIWAQESGEEQVIGAGSFEFTVESNYIVHTINRTVGGGPVESVGFSARVGYRPARIERWLFEGYAAHSPRPGGVYPRFDAIGVTASRSLRGHGKKLNPFLMIGIGVYREDVPDLTYCIEDPLCMYEGPDFDSFTAVSLTPGIGANVSIIPHLALRFGAEVYVPVGLQETEMSGVRPALFGGVTLRP